MSIKKKVPPVTGYLCGVTISSRNWASVCNEKVDIHARMFEAFTYTCLIIVDI